MKRIPTLKAKYSAFRHFSKNCVETKVHVMIYLLNNVIHPKTWGTLLRKEYRLRKHYKTINFFQLNFLNTIDQGPCPSIQRLQVFGITTETRYEPASIVANTTCVILCQFWCGIRTLKISN